MNYFQPTERVRIPHTWRTRKNPFENIWTEICSWLEIGPDRTAKSISEEIRFRYPDQYHNGQLRTLQRYVKAWRSEALLTFEYEWLKDELTFKNKRLFSGLFFVLNYA